MKDVPIVEVSRDIPPKGDCLLLRQSFGYRYYLPYRTETENQLGTASALVGRLVWLPTW